MNEAAADMLPMELLAVIMDMANVLANDCREMELCACSAENHEVNSERRQCAVIVGEMVQQRATALFGGTKRVLCLLADLAGPSFRQKADLELATLRDPADFFTEARERHRHEHTKGMH